MLDINTTYIKWSCHDSDGGDKSTFGKWTVKSFKCVMKAANESCRVDYFIRLDITNIR